MRFAHKLPLAVAIAALGAAAGCLPQQTEKLAQPADRALPASADPVEVAMPATPPTAPETPSVAAPTAKVPAAPVARREAVTDTFHGVEITEHYRWLEDWKDEAVQAWSRGQANHARAVLDALPGREAIGARVAAALGSALVSYWDVQPVGGRVFAMKLAPPKQQPFLIVSEGLDPAQARILLDPAVIDDEGTTAIDWVRPSHSGKLVAVSLSKAGTESGDVHIYDVATGEQVHEVIVGVNGGTAGGDLAWDADDSGFYYTRYPRGDEQPDAEKSFWVQLYHHTLGQPTEDDRYELGKGQPKIAEYRLQVHASGRVLCTIQDGDGGEFAIHLREPGETGAWTQFSTFGDKVLNAHFGPSEDLLLLSRRDAPRGKVLRAALADVVKEGFDPASASVVVPQSEHTIVEDFWGPATIVPTATRIFVRYQLGGPSMIRVLAHDGSEAPGPALPPVSATGSLVPLGGDRVLYQVRSFTSPTRYEVFDGATAETTPTGFVESTPYAMDGVTVTREMATSKDGTQVPVNLLVPAGTAQDGSAPCMVYSYGGYGVNIEPAMRSRNYFFVSHGVTYAIANIRGGGEFGAQWHRQGNLTAKQNVFDDFTAVMEHLVSTKRCDPDRIGMIGGSNGGLLMGAVMTQHPDLAKVVLSFVGIYDMLRVELSANGAFNITEFGTVKDEAQFKAMAAYSPYHNVSDGTAYPPVLFITGENDPRVDPMQSRKMTARLSHAIAGVDGAGPVLLRTTADAGHGGDTKISEVVAQYTDAVAFALHHLGVTVADSAKE